jgi:hypothetical protein
MELKTPTLDEVLAYECSDVVYRFRKTYGITHEESADIFEQVKKWMWLAHQRRLAGLETGLSIDIPIVVIDEMWHNFVLFTKEYTAFCKDFFGYYVHHAPTTEAEETGHRSHLQSLPRLERMQARKDRMREQYEYIYDHLGKDAFVKWYLEYPKTYGYRRLAELQLQAVDAKLAEVQPQAQAVAA